MNTNTENNESIPVDRHGKAGRPTKYNEETIGHFLEGLSDGLPIESALRRDDSHARAAAARPQGLEAVQDDSDDDSILNLKPQSNHTMKNTNLKVSLTALTMLAAAAFLAPHAAQAQCDGMDGQPVKLTSLRA